MPEHLLPDELVGNVTLALMIPIEDNFEDVLGKAMRGLGLSAGELADCAELSDDSLSSLLNGEYDPSSARRAAKILGLNGACLHELATRAEAPLAELPRCIVLKNTPFPIPGYEEMTVNSYAILADDGAESGYLIDAGDSYDSLPSFNRESYAANWQLLLTHTHADHVTNLDLLSSRVACVYSPELEHLPDTSPVKEGDTFSCGQWRLTAIGTPGHSPGGTSYLLEGARVPVVFAGDAIFCYSIGKVPKGYGAALEHIRKKILSLPNETILCPGHGPLTTVEFEKEHNPFFAS